MKLLEDFADRLEAIRLAKGLSKKELAKKSGVSLYEISGLQLGIRDIGVVAVSKLADALSVSMSDLFSRYEINMDQYTFENYAEKCKCCEQELRNIETLRVFYPQNIRNQRMSSLIEFAVYLPLIDLRDILHVFAKLHGDFNHQEAYLSEQFAWLVDSIPESLEREYADYVFSIIQQRKNMSTPTIYVDIDEHAEARKAYCEFTEKKRIHYQKISDLLAYGQQFGFTQLPERSKDD